MVRTKILNIHLRGDNNDDIEQDPHTRHRPTVSNKRNMVAHRRAAQQEEEESGPSQFPAPNVDPVEGNQEGNDYDDDDDEDPQDISLLATYLNHVAHQIWIGKVNMKHFSFDICN
ncbi:hypothetical protein RIF29_03503 [Crotalaria pallida]|uniref:Uncharacterized protein n=1 Tax=Crotalaria pallida TaxID=3830 RepID=A0AAN9J117_CROPI